MKTEDGKKAFYSKIDQNEKQQHMHTYRKQRSSHYHYSNYAEMNIHFTRHLHNSVQFNNFNVAATNARLYKLFPLLEAHAFAFALPRSHTYSRSVNVLRCEYNVMFHIFISSGAVSMEIY